MLRIWQEIQYRNGQNWGKDKPTKRVSGTGLSNIYLLPGHGETGHSPYEAFHQKTPIRKSRTMGSEDEYTPIDIIEYRCDNNVTIEIPQMNMDQAQGYKLRETQV
jgi:hypothetical protein